MYLKIGFLSILLIIVLASAINLYIQDVSTIEGDDNEIHTIHMPVEGVWKLVRSPGHDAYAFDLVKVEPDTHKKLTTSRLQHLLGNTKAADWYSWNEGVYSPAAGVVVHSHNDSADRKHQALLKDVWKMIFNRPDLKDNDLSNFAGNHVLIKGDGFYLFLAHLQQHSLAVADGDTVEKGDFIGLVGNSGVSLEPHLHFQLFDQIDDFHSATAPPFLVTNFERWTGEKWERVQNAPLKKGDLIHSISWKYGFKI